MVRWCSIIALLAIALSSGCGGATPETANPDEAAEGAAGQPGRPAVSEQAPALLATLAERVKELEALDLATLQEPTERGGDLDVAPLVGLTRPDIEAALGQPWTCTESKTDAEGNKIPVAPCTSSTDIFFSFYRLPNGWVGGGPELLLQFDAAGYCSKASWAQTQ